jgi:uncharacterized SAM-binding protein YcdF (DUF218 family)
VLGAAFDFAKQTLHPSTAAAVVLYFGIATALLYVRTGRWGRRCLTALVVAYWGMSSPACAPWLERPLTAGYPTLNSADQMGGATVVVLLSGGTQTYTAFGRSLTTTTDASAFRALEAARIYHLIGRATVIASGGVALRKVQAEPEGTALQDVLVKLGVAPDDIIVESDSRTTYEEALRVRPILARLGAGRFVLVTSPAHMRRSIAVFKALGLDPVPSMARSESDFERENPFIPRRHALVESDAALYEYAALAYYWTRGRLRPWR